MVEVNVRRYIFTPTYIIEVVTAAERCNLLDIEQVLINSSQKGTSKYLMYYFRFCQSGGILNLDQLRFIINQIMKHLEREYDKNYPTADIYSFKYCYILKALQKYINWDPNLLSLQKWEYLKYKIGDALNIQKQLQLAKNPNFGQYLGEHEHKHSIMEKAFYSFASFAPNINYNFLSQLLCCSQYLYENQWFIKSELDRKSIFCFEELSLPSIISKKKQNQNYAKLGRLFCSVCNHGGGIILFGFKTEGQNSVVLGIEMKSHQELVSIENFIQLSKKMVYPSFQLLIQRVPIMLPGIDSVLKKQKLCFRIKINPQYHRQLYYLQANQYPLNQSKNYYEIYVFDDKFKPTKVNHFQNGLYESISTVYYKKRRDLIHQYNIGCIKPGYFDADSFFQLNKQANVPFKDIPFLSDYNHISSQYSQSALLIVQQQKYEDEIRKLTLLMDEKKVKYQLSKPFEEFYHLIQRQIWLISLKLNFQGLKSFLKFAENAKKVTPGKITMMPIYKNIELPRNKLSLKNQKYVESKIKQKYSTPFDINEIQVIDKNNVQKTMVQFAFQTVGQSLYAYLILQSMKLRPYFTKHGNIYKIENKKQKYIQKESQ